MSFFKPNSKSEDAYSRHKKLIRAYLSFYGGSVPANIPENYKTEKEIVRENHKFVRSEDEGLGSWEQRVAKKYYDTLFKEYAVCELKYYKEGKIALRWRVEKEVMSGKGQFICGSTKCLSAQQLKSWEVNFGYVEDGEKKNELVKVRLCPACSDKLNYKTKKRLAEEKKRETKKRRLHSDKEKNQKDENSSDESESSSSEEDQKERESENNVWSKAIGTKEEKSKEEEYEDYFADLLQ
ncbi:folate-sensitive fragile site protein Fra10Ac1-domain-containing protein [Sporodiniella umbellata]|nr:folate-sensitive fragile site protein Fra10Ac1-domain-containing protein [Sporodiniella umbellata]